MSIIGKLKDIYMAKSLAQLNKKAEETKALIKVNDVLNCTNIALNLYTAAKYAVFEGDEEKAYVLFYRFIDLYQQIRKSNDYSKHKTYVEQMISTSIVNEALYQSDLLSVCVEKRYQALCDSELPNTKSNDSLVDDYKSIIKSKNLESDSEDGKYPVIDCTILLEIMENSSEITKILIIDTRSAHEYNDSHISAKFKTSGDITVINIPNDILTPGITANKIEKSLPFGISRDAFARRRGMNKVVIIDKNSHEFTAFSYVYIVAEALWKWDQSAYKIKSKPLLLKGGYDEWIATYSLYSTNAKVLSKMKGYVASIEKMKKNTQENDALRTALIKTKPLFSGSTKQYNDFPHKNKDQTNKNISSKSINRQTPGTDSSVLKSLYKPKAEKFVGRASNMFEQTSNKINQKYNFLTFVNKYNNEETNEYCKDDMRNIQTKRENQALIKKIKTMEEIQEENDIRLAIALSMCEIKEKQMKSSKQVKSISDNDENRLLCKICMDRELSVVYMPCRHQITCIECAPKFKECPICRKIINETMTVFIP